MEEYLSLSIWSIIITIASPIICAVIADRKGRSVGGWVCGGLLLGLIGVIIISCLSNLSASKSSYHPPKQFYTTAQNNQSNSTSAPKQPKRMAEVPSYRCPNCQEIIDTLQCPFCGHKK